MGYLNVLHYLQDFKVDRVILDEFDAIWANDLAAGEVSLDTVNKTAHNNGLLIEDMDSGEKVYQNLTSPLRLDDRTHIHLHILAAAPTPEEGEEAEDYLYVHLSDNSDLALPVLSLPIPVTSCNGSPASVKIAIQDPELLNSIKSIGFTTTEDAVTFEVMLFDVICDDYIITKEQLDGFEVSGVNYVLSKIDETALPAEDPRLQEAVYMAGAAFAWMWRYEHETHAWDYGDKLSTKNYAIRLLRESERACEEYLTGGDTGDAGDFKKLRLKGAKKMYSFQRS